MHALAFRFLPIAAMAALLVATSFGPALAQTPPAPTPNKGDMAWMLIATVLVLLMTIPGLALFYAGLVRAKNVVSMLLQVFAIVCMVAIIWVIYGYSLAFTSGGSLNDYVGGFSKVFLMGVTPEVHGRHLLQRRRHPRARLHLLPDDLRLHHAGADRRRLRGAHEILRSDAVRRAVGHIRLFPDRAHGLVLGRPRRPGRRRQGGR